STAVTLVGNGLAGNKPNQPENPEELFIDSTDNLYVADTSNNRVLKCSKGSQNGVLVAGSNHDLNYPIEIFVFTENNQTDLYMADSRNHRAIPVSDNESGIKIIAGRKGEQGQTDDSLSFPTGIFIDKDKTL
ncbi:unnamed protein product, partial [Didymodactylos carnosus]